MAGNKSQYLENAQLNWLKGSTYPAAPANTYVALFTAAPDDTGGGTEVSTSGTAYARQAIASSGWSAISGGPGTPEQISNSGAVTFPTATGAGFGTVVAVGLFDALTNGNLLYWKGISSQAIAAGVQASFAIGSLIITDD